MKRKKLCNKLFILLLFLELGQMQAQNLSLSRKFINVESALVNAPSQADTFSLVMNNFSNDLLIVTHFPFELSSNGILFNDSLSFSASLSNTSITVYLRILPNLADSIFRDEIAFQDGGNLVNQKIYVMGNSIVPNQSLSLCSWNMKWFGLPSQCNCDTTLSLFNAAQLLKEIHADIFALQEVVSIDQLDRLTQELGSDYSFTISDYGSQVENASSTGYEDCQKMAFIYNHFKVSNQGVFGLLRSTYPAFQSSTSPYYYFSSGRWPYVFKAKVLNSLSNDEFVITNLHAKAFAGTSEHNRRAGGAVYMADSLNMLYPNEKVIIIGDYNDLIEGAITTGFVLSPYNYILNNNFFGLTYPSLFPGEKTYIGSSGSIIDNILVSNEAHSVVIPNSTKIIREAELSISNYQNTTSDHLPIITYFRTNTNTGIKEVRAEVEHFRLIQPNGQNLTIKIPPSFLNAQTEVVIYGMDGNKLFERTFIPKTEISESALHLNPGLYLVRIFSNGIKETKKWIIP